MDLQLLAVEIDASAIERFYKPKQKQSLEFKYDCNPWTGSQNIVNTVYFLYTWTWIFDLMTQKSNQFIGSSRYIHDCVQSLMAIGQWILEICKA